MADLLEIRSLTTSFRCKNKNNLPVIEDISFSIKQGETVGIVGESGCGKSMTALSIMQLLPPNGVMNQGSSIVLDGQELVGLTERNMRKIRGNDISMIFQEPMTSLNPVLKVGPQIKEIIELHDKLEGQETKNKAISLLKDVGIPRAEDIYDEYPHRLSGGMRQRVMIAIAIACHPKLLIADEPTTALDVTIQAQILDLMRKMKTERHMSIMMITHDLGVVAEMCDRVIIMYAGKIVESTDVKTLFQNPQHPYTKGLIASLPAKGIGQSRLTSIPGNVPTIDNRLTGCRFAPRCGSVHERCYHIEPPAILISDEHVYTCWLNQPIEREIGASEGGQRWRNCLR